MSRDSIIDEAAENKQDTEPAESAGDTEEESQDEEGEEGRTRLTQRVPDDLLDDVETVQEKYRLPSRNATINFILTTGIEDLLEESER